MLYKKSDYQRVFDDEENQEQTSEMNKDLERLKLAKKPKRNKKQPNTNNPMAVKTTNKLFVDVSDQQADEDCPAIEKQYIADAELQIAPIVKSKKQLQLKPAPIKPLTIDKQIKTLIADQEILEVQINIDQKSIADNTLLLNKFSGKKECLQLLIASNTQTDKQALTRIGKGKIKDSNVTEIMSNFKATELGDANDPPPSPTHANEVPSPDIPQINPDIANLNQESQETEQLQEAPPAMAFEEQCPVNKK